MIRCSETRTGTQTMSKEELIARLRNLTNLEILEGYGYDAIVIVICRVSGAARWFEVLDRKFVKVEPLADHLLTISDTWEYTPPVNKD